ncbi:MAG: type I-U CRISPR-associated protein Cas7 [Deltaproteobacteria bacterium]|nr:type I-U CRISPR-associated protein Cas7 [Deltaproteobacteria bacterium]
METLDLRKLRSAAEKDSMLRLRLDLEPAGAGGLVYPPTYDQGQHIFRKAWVDGEVHDVVLLDSAQSQSNRIEMAILDAYRRGEIRYPDIVVKVNLPDGEEEYSVLELSHRVYDAALLQTVKDGRTFRETPIGKEIFEARTDRASGLFRQAPITLVLGGWDSHSGGGPKTAKIQRAVTSEIIGLDAFPVSRGAVKADPMDIRKNAGPVFPSKDPKRRIELDVKEAADKKPKNPSDVGLGNVPSMEDRGATIRMAQQTSLISLTAIRRLRFEDESDKYSVKRDNAGHTALATLGLYGLLGQMEGGYALRSGCDLIPLKTPTIEIIGQSLSHVEPFEIDVSTARLLLEESLDEAERLGLKWREEPFQVEADDRLQELVRRSRISKIGEEE